MTNTNKNQSRIPLGMSSFGFGGSGHTHVQTPQHKEREQFGQNIRLAMSCIERSSEPVKGNAIPSDEKTIRKRLKGYHKR